VKYVLFLLKGNSWFKVLLCVGLFMVAGIFGSIIKANAEKPVSAPDDRIVESWDDLADLYLAGRVRHSQIVLPFDIEAVLSDEDWSFLEDENWYMTFNQFAFYYPKKSEISAACTGKCTIIVYENIYDDELLILMQSGDLLTEMAVFDAPVWPDTEDEDILYDEFSKRKIVWEMELIPTADFTTQAAAIPVMQPMMMSGSGSGSTAFGITNIARTPSGCLLSFPSQTSSYYRIKTGTSLVPYNWTYTNMMLGTDAGLTWTDSGFTNEVLRFYYIEEVLQQYAGDADDDGLNDVRELQINANPLTVDEDGDGMTDWWEIMFMGSMTNGPLGDYDADGVNNWTEFNNRTRPDNADTTTPFVTLSQEAVFVP